MGWVALSADDVVPSSFVSSCFSVKNKCLISHILLGPFSLISMNSCTFKMF